jgi:Ca-activated chloride channel family protein
VSFELARPAWLSLLGLIPLWWWWVSPKGRWGLLIARGEEAREIALKGWVGAAIGAVPRLLRAAGIACVILALGQPQTVRTYQERAKEGVGIALAIDLSTSMRAKDMAQSTTRLQAAKATILGFLAKRTDDVGLIVFAGEALTRLPLTHDRYVAESAVGALEIGLLGDGTDIAGAITAAVGLLRDAPHRSKVLILVTDGAHNKSGLEPAQAARAAAAYGVRIYAIAIGSEKPGSSGGDVETVLTQAARITGGKYFHATDLPALERIYTEIDDLAVVPAEALTERTASISMAPWFLLTSLVLVLAGATLRASRWGVVP